MPYEQKLANRERASNDVNVTRARGGIAIAGYTCEPRLDEGIVRGYRGHLGIIHVDVEWRYRLISPHTRKDLFNS